MSEQKKILKFIKRVRRRLCMNALFKMLMLGACGGTLAGLLLDVASLFIPIYYVDYYVIGCAGAGIITGIILGIIRMPGRQKAALFADSKGLDERLVTSLESFEKEDGFYNLQRLDTVKHIEQFNLKGNIRLTFPYRRLPVLAAFIIGIVICGRMDSPARQLAEDMHILKEAVEDKAEKLEKVQEEMRDNSLLTEAEKDKLEDLLQASNEELSEVLKKEKIDTIMERLDTKLKKEEEKNASQALSKEVEAIQEKLDLPSNALKQQQESELAKNLKEALKELTNGDKEQEGGLSEEELEKLAQELADKMMEAGDQEGELSEDEISQLAQAMEVDPENLKAALAKANSQTQQMASAGSDGSSVSAGSQSGGAQGEGSGSGNGSGSGSCNGSGSGSGGGGMGGTGWDTGSKNGFEKVTEANNAPEQLNIPDRAWGDDDNLTGTNTEGSSYLTSSDMGLSYRGQSVDYNSVVGEYTSSAMSRLNQSKIPDAMKDAVKKYFSELNQ